jgi:hypothetical protein
VHSVPSHWPPTGGRDDVFDERDVLVEELEERAEEERTEEERTDDESVDDREEADDPLDEVGVLTH